MMSLGSSLSATRISVKVRVIEIKVPVPFIEFSYPHNCEDISILMLSILYRRGGGGGPVPPEQGNFSFLKFKPAESQ